MADSPGDELMASRGARVRLGGRGNSGPASWPELGTLGLSAREQAARRHSIGASDANVILSGVPERVLRLWQEKRGEVESEDLSGNLAVMLGCWTEAFNRQWYEQLTGERVTQMGDVRVCDQHEWRTATLDGYIAALGAVFEAKHTSAFAKSEELLARYMPQLQHAMAVAGCERAVLSVIYGNSKWECYEVAADWLYQAELLEAELRFWECVQSGTPPVAAAVPPAPKPIGVREVCLEGNNLWATSAADWLQHRLAAKTHAEASQSLKRLVEDDVARAWGHGIEVKRSKAGALTIRELERESAR
jgi:predicted phage-related endonuclease